VTGTFNLEDILKPHALEERICRLRCVEAWSTVIPWVGFPLNDLIKRFRPTSRAKYVAFYANVDPAVDHPRWSQAKERKIGAGVFAPRQPTLPFNGYAEQVAGLYRGLDLRKNF
jgi:DMSO/TMAO reductase YedYZ molybdopterin-dependent catalytic subunit